GARGGMRLCVDPHEVTMRQVIEAIQGPVYVATCGTAGPEGAACPFRPECHFNPVWCEAERILTRYFDSISLYEVVCEHKHPALTRGSGFEVLGPAPQVPDVPSAR
ncbi:MAG: Rrf2 family transcriptional regulator, partial [Parafannyhessea umbonata]